MVFTHLYRFKLGAGAGSESTQQKPQATGGVAATYLVPSELCGGTRPQGVVMVRPVVFISPKQTKISLCEGRALHQLGM